MRRALVLAILVVSAAAILPAAPRTAFMLGVLRRDGVLIPFAAFNGRDWSDPWPSSDTSVPLPINLDGVPKKWWGPVAEATPWTAWMVADGTSRPLKIEQPVQVRVFCGGHVGLKTDYTSKQPFDLREPSIAKDALVVSADPKTVQVEDIPAVSLLTMDAAQMVKTITDEFNRAEEASAERFTDWRHPYSAREREKYPIELEAFYRRREHLPGSEWLASYVEAVRRFPSTAEDKGCGLITWVRGWVVERTGAKPEIHLTATVTYCDREGVSFMQPLGEITAAGDIYWVFQMSSWRDEAYTVARMRPNEVKPVVIIGGGDCPRQ
jgi:hypothetical protein